MGEAIRNGPGTGGEPSTTQVRLWFGLLGGASAWLTHLLLAYGIAEFGSVSSVGEIDFLGFSSVAWMLALASLMMLGIAVYACRVAHRNWQASADSAQTTSVEEDNPRIFIARSSLLTSRSFVFIIAVQSMPMLYCVRGC